MHRAHLVAILRLWCSAVLTVGVAWLAWPSALGGDVTYVLVSGTSMEPGLHTGDLVLVRARSGYEVGDAVAFRVPAGEVGAGSIVIHRIVGGDERGYVTQGDNRDRPDLWRPAADDVVGERYLLVPGLGSALGRARAPASMAGLAAVLAFAVVAVPSRDRRPSTP